MIKRIISARQTVKLDFKGDLERWRVIDYMLDDYGPLTIEMPEKDFSYEKVGEIMDEEIKGLEPFTK